MEPTSDVAGSSSGGGSSSRWNPTKEQLSMLESLYGQGIRTPSAEQIQSITKRLQVYGHIEGKNVFYWFQNHKARQRQKQKLDQMTTANNNNNNVVVNNGNAAAYFNRFYYPSPPLSPTVAVVPARAQSFFPAAPHNVSYGPYYIAHPEYGLNPHCPKMVLPNQILSNSETPGQIRHDFHRDVAKFGAQNVANAGVNVAYPSNTFMERSGQVTLDLFPVHPTGILEDRECHRSPTTGSSTENSLEAGSDQDRPSGVGFDMFSKVRK